MIGPYSTDAGIIRSSVELALGSGLPATLEFDVTYDDVPTFIDLIIRPDINICCYPLLSSFEIMDDNCVAYIH